MPVSPYPILATDPNEMLTQMQSLMDDLYQNRIGGANVGDVFQIGSDDVLQLKYLSIGGLQKINGSLSVKPNNDLGLDSAADGLFVKLKADNGLAVDTNGIYVKLKTGGGLSVDATGLALSVASSHNILSTSHTDAVGADSVEAGDLLYGNSTPKWDRLAKGTAYQVVGMNAGATLPEWQASTRSTLSGTGDMVYASSANALARLIKGAEGTLIRAGATIPTYSTLTMPDTIAAGSVFASNTANVLTAINSTSGTKYLKNAAGTISWDTVTVSAAGSDTHVQFNDGGTTLAGDADLTWNKTTHTLISNGFQWTGTAARGSEAGYLYIDAAKTWAAFPYDFDMNGIVKLSRAYGTFDSTAPGIEQYTPVQSIYATCGLGSAGVIGIGAAGLSIFLEDSAVGLAQAPNMIGIRVGLYPKKDRVAAYYDDVAAFTADNASGNSGYTATDAFYVSANGPNAASGKWSWLTSFQTDARSLYGYRTTGTHDYGFYIGGTINTALFYHSAFVIGSTGQVTTGSWHATTIDAAHGGTGATTLTGILVGNGTSAFTAITDSHTNWDTAYTDRLKWDGGATGLTAATGRTSLGLSSSDSPTFVTVNTTTSITMANANAININSKSAVYGNGTAVYFGWGFASNHTQIAGTGYTLSVDSGFVKATAD